MRIGVFAHSWWKPACHALGHETVDLPVAQHPSGNVHAADLGARIANGVAVLGRSRAEPVDLLLDNGGAGLGFAQSTSKPGTLSPVHEELGKPLCSHFIDPVVTALQGMGWPEVWQSLQSATWVKAVWDRAQAMELQRFGVPSVMHLPMAAPNRPYCTDPMDTARCRPVVSFVGGQNTSYFASNTTVPTSTLLAGTLAQSIRADLPQATFFDAYHEVFGLGEPPTPGDDLNIRANKAAAYFNAKLFFNATQCIRNRDRFVIFLKRKLGDQFHLAGTGWDRAYGLPAAGPLPTVEEYFAHFREAAINLNLVNGNGETGLNMRHFEITAAGGFMLCYQQPELDKCFEVGKECITFRNEQDLLEKIRYYLGRPDERAAIALAGQRRTLSEHLFSHRLGALLNSLANVKPAPVEFSSAAATDDFKLLNPEPEVVLDCGANVGQMAGMLRNTYPNAKIYSFEPVSAVFEQLRAKCAAINATPVKKAVADHDGKSWINLTTSPEANSLLGYEDGNPCAKWTRIVGKEEVEVCTLDRWCEQAGVDPRKVGLLKLDVQGAELKALYGARKLLETTKLVYLEVSFVPIYKDCPLFDEIDRFMTECGYRRHAVYPSDQPHNWGDALYIKA